MLHRIRRIQEGVIYHLGKATFPALPTNGSKRLINEEGEVEQVRRIEILREAAMHVYRRVVRSTTLLDYCEFSGMSYRDVHRNVRRFRELNKVEFARFDSEEAFYAYSETYIFDLLSANLSKGTAMKKLNGYVPGMEEQIRRHTGRKLLEFGGGVGSLSGYIQEHLKKDVTYVDVKGHVSDFAKWRFAKYAVPIDVRITPHDEINLDGHFDVIVTDAVFEHFDSVKQYDYAGRLVDLLNPGGLLFFFVDTSGPSEDYPMHHRVDIEALHDVLGERTENQFGRNRFASVWKRR